jgi:hypothetical protein
MAFSLFQWQQQQQIETNTFGIWFFSHWLMENPPPKSLTQRLKVALFVKILTLLGYVI